MGEEMVLPNWQVYGVPAVLMLVAIINWMKDSFNMDTKWTFPVATGMAAAFGVMLYLSSLYEIALTIMQIVMGAVLLGLAASGYYTGVKQYIKRNGF